MSDHPVFVEHEVAIFRHGDREFQAFLQDDGSLQVTVTGRFNRSVLVAPASNNSVRLIIPDRVPRQ